MAPKAKKSVKATAKAAPKAAAKAVAKPVVKAAPMASKIAEGACCNTSSCCGCPVLGLLFSRTTLALWVMSFAIIATFSMVWHSQMLGARYLETAALWLPESAMRFDIMMGAHAAIALVFAILFQMAMCCGKGIGMGIKTGILITAPLGIAACFYPMATQAIPADILYMWGLEWVVLGVLLGTLGGWLLKGSCCGTSCSR